MSTSTNRTRRWWIAGAGVGLLVVIGAFVASTAAVDIPFTEVQYDWSIGLASGTSPLDATVSAASPILDRSDVPLDDVLGVADPFLLVDGDTWYLYMEVIQRRIGFENDEKGVIGVATSHDEGESWTYEGEVVDEPWHLSYPLVFEVDGGYAMVPESSSVERITLYRSETPLGPWMSDTVLVEGAYTDPTVFERDGSWWMFATSSTDEPDDTLHLFRADQLEGPWSEAPVSPIVTNDNGRARSAGYVVDDAGALYRFAQDGREGYGRAVRVFRIDVLTAESYVEEEALEDPIVAGDGEGWNAVGMHQIAWVRLPDGRWVASVDGFKTLRVFGLGVR